MARSFIVAGNRVLRCMRSGTLSPLAWQTPQELRRVRVLQSFLLTMDSPVDNSEAGSEAGSGAVSDPLTRDDIPAIVRAVAEAMAQTQSLQGSSGDSQQGTIVTACHVRGQCWPRVELEPSLARH